MTEGVTDLVRGTLCPALKALFEHGLKKPSLLGGACHPWLFIEEVITIGPCAFSVPELQCSPQSFPGFLEEVEGACRAVGCAHPSLSSYSQAAGREVERDFDSVYSRLVLCKTYRYVILPVLPASVHMAASDGPPVLAGWMKMAKS